MRRTIFVLFYLLAGCTTMHPTGKSLTVTHAFPNFSAAAEKARVYCASMGLEAHHLGTDRGGAAGMLSRFECVAQ